MDGKHVELGLWRRAAKRFVGPDLADAIDALGELQAEMDRRLGWPCSPGTGSGRCSSSAVS